MAMKLSPSSLFPCSKKDNLSYGKPSVFAKKSLSKTLSPISASFKNDTPLKPIILGEIHKTANAPLTLLYNIDKLKENNVNILAVESNISTEDYKKRYFPLLKKYIPFVQEKVRQIMDDPHFPEDECNKILIWLTDRKVKHLFQLHISNNIDYSLSDSLKFSPEISLFGKEMACLADKFIKTLNKEKVMDLYVEQKLAVVTSSKIINFLCAEKGFEYYSIDRGREYSEIITGENSTQKDALILRDQGLIEEIQELTRNTTMNVISIMGLSHVVALKTHYPDIAVYKNVTNIKDFSLEEMRCSDELDFSYVKNIESKTYLDDAFQSRNPDALLIEPSAEVLEVLYRLTKEKKL